MRYSGYVICATPRSGSTLLCDLLTATRAAGHPQSHLRVQDISGWAKQWGVAEPRASSAPPTHQAFLAAMVLAGTADTAMFGLRLMWPTVYEATERFNAARGGKMDLPSRLEQEIGATLFIQLSRDDKVAQAVSLVRAEQTGLWHVHADGSERQRTAPPRAPVFDPDRIAQAHRTLSNEKTEWSRFFERHGIAPLRLRYEDLAANPPRVLAETLTALGLDPAHAIGVNARTARMADATGGAWTSKMMPD